MNPYTNRTKKLQIGLDEEALIDSSIKYPFELVIKRTGHFFIHKSSIEEYQKVCQKKGFDFVDDLAMIGYVLVEVSKDHSLILF